MYFHSEVVKSKNKKKTKKNNTIELKESCRIYVGQTPHQKHNFQTCAIQRIWYHIGKNTRILTSAIASQINSLTIVYPTICSDADQRKHQSSASQAVRGIHQGPMNSPHKWPVTGKMFPFDDVIIERPHAFAFTVTTGDCHKDLKCGITTTLNIS